MRDLKFIQNKVYKSLFQQPPILENPGQFQDLGSQLRKVRCHSINT